MKRSSKHPLRVGLIGCGNISNQYFAGTKPFGKYVVLTTCADRDAGRARAKAEEHGIVAARSPKSLLADPEVDIVLNLTIPKAHARVNLAALRAGKHVYCEKPFSLTVQEGSAVIAEAKKRRLRVGCAPDTVLGGAVQTCRRLVESGRIGRPVAFTANMLNHGHEGWHPDPAFYYQPGGGPLFDMGPYYLATLVSVLGPVKSVTALAAKALNQRVITSHPRKGEKIEVRVPTHLVGLLEFVQGAVGTVTMSFDVWAHKQPILEIYGLDGSLSCADPNQFHGELTLRTASSGDWETIAPTAAPDAARGMGLADMGRAIQQGDAHRLSAELGLHLVEVMEAFGRSARLGCKISLKTTCSKPAILSPHRRSGQIR